MTVTEHIVLRSGRARCEILPETGAIAGFWWERGDERIDWLHPLGDGDTSGCLPVIPWTGPIRDGRFRFGSMEVAPGDTPAEGWRATAQSASRVSLDCLHEPDAWPWRYRARQIVQLGDDGLSLSLEIENLSDELMPAALGFHPEFPRTPMAMLRAKARGIWHRDSGGLPYDWTPLPAEGGLADGRAVGELDDAFSGWDGRARITWPERRHCLDLDGTWPVLSFLTVRAAPEEASFSVAPASQCADAINLARAGAAETGVRVLAPGARRRVGLTLRPHADEPS